MYSKWTFLTIYCAPWKLLDYNLCHFSLGPISTIYVRISGFYEMIDGHGGGFFRKIDRIRGLRLKIVIAITSALKFARHAKIHYRGQQCSQRFKKDNHCFSGGIWNNKLELGPDMIWRTYKYMKWRPQFWIWQTVFESARYSNRIWNWFQNGL